MNSHFQKLKESPMEDHFYFELKEGKVYVTESPENDHSWLWKHDYTRCRNSHIPKEEHMRIWKDFMKKRKLFTSQNGFSVPKYIYLDIKFTSLYESSDFLLLATSCGKKHSFYLIYGILPDEILSIMSDDERLLKYLKDHYSHLDYFSSKSDSLNVYGHLPILIHSDLKYRYQVFKLSGLREESPLYFIEVICHSHGNRKQYAFKNENLARRFVEDYENWSFRFCK